MHCAKCLISKMPLIKLIAQVQMCTQLHSKSTQSSVFPSTRRLMLCQCNYEIPLLVSEKCLILKKNPKWCASCFVTVITGSFFSAAWGDGRQVACARLFQEPSHVPQLYCIVLYYQSRGWGPWLPRTSNNQIFSSSSDPSWHVWKQVALDVLFYTRVYHIPHLALCLFLAKKIKRLRPSSNFSVDPIKMTLWYF